MSEEKPNAGFFDEEEEITLSENELNNILNNSTIELEEATENLENLESGPSSEDNLTIMSGSELEQEYLSKVSKVENPLDDFKLLREGSNLQEETSAETEFVVETEAPQEPKIEEISMESTEELSIQPQEEETPIIMEENIEEQAEKADSAAKSAEEIIIDESAVTPKAEEIAIDENIVIEEIQEDEILLDDNEEHGAIEEISLENEEEIQEPEETQELVIEEDTQSISLEEGTIEGSELGEIKAESDAIIEQEVVSQAEEKPEIIDIKENIIPVEENEISIVEEMKVSEGQDIIKETPTLEETGNLETEEGIEEQPIIEEGKIEEEPIVVEGKAENIPTDFFKEEKSDLQEAELSAHVDEILIEEPAVQEQSGMTAKTEEAKSEEKAALSGMIKEAANLAPENVKNVLLYLDSLFAYLPEDKIREFAKSKYYDMYNKIFDDLGL